MANTIYCVDFDGTIVKHKYPEIGGPVPQAIEVMKDLIKRGDKIILYTMRGTKPHIEKVTKIDPHTGAETIETISRNTLQEAVDYLKANGVELYGINANKSQMFWTNSKKIYGHVYIDDAALGCPLIDDPTGRPYVDWIKVRELLFPNEKKD